MHSSAIFPFSILLEVHLVLGYPASGQLCLIDSCYILLLQDYSQQPPAQELIAKDLHGNEWKFRHIFRGEFLFRELI